MNDTTKKFRALVRKIEKSNDQFRKASRSQKIVMVSKDILALLDLKRIEASTGTYFEVEGVVDVSSLEKKGTCQVSEILKLPDLPTCNVCAIGGAMLASTLRLNKVKTDCFEGKTDFLYGIYANPHDIPRDKIGKNMSLRARQVFPHDLLRLMESAFENGYFGYNGNATKRLHDIYQNLVDNEGKKFTHRKLPEKVVYVVGKGTTDYGYWGC